MNRVDTCKKLFTKHGAKVNGMVEPAYRSWGMMKNRCNNKKSQDYPYYGGRGITYCKEWETYEGFIADMGLPPEKGMTLERINSDWNYAPLNCKWATRLEQSRNRDYCKTYTLLGQTKYASDWAKDLRINVRVFYSRYKKHAEHPTKYTEEWVLRGGHL